MQKEIEPLMEDKKDAVKFRAAAAYAAGGDRALALEAKAVDKGRSARNHLLALGAMADHVRRRVAGDDGRRRRWRGGTLLAALPPCPG